jgi:hypothetical protein
MSFWTPENKQKVIDAYRAKDPTPETSVEIIKEIADSIGQTANGVRMILVQAEVYVKKDATATAAKATKADGAKSTRVSKEDSIAALRAAIEAKGKDVDDEILGKLTGKAAVYLLSVLE